MPRATRIATRSATCAFVASTCCAGPLAGHALLERTELIDVRYGTPASDLVREQSHRGVELSDGTFVPFDDWYAGERRDLGATFFTQIDETLGLYWGFTTGERGPKYRIEPSLRIGFLKQWRLSRHEDITLSASAVVGGWIRERTCIADYGEIGGVQTVNCRLSDSTLPPAETLKYLLDQPPAQRLRLTLSYSMEF